MGEALSAAAQGPTRFRLSEARTDAEWEQACAVLRSVYIGEGYTAAQQGQQAMQRANLEDAGTMLIAQRDDGTVLGATLYLHEGSRLRQLAEVGEREFRMLAVGAEARGEGVGEALVRACIDRAEASGARALVLWTQPGMLAAHRLYERLGFVRTSERDVPDARGFTRLVYVRRFPR